jgi:hypothetical protein
LKTRRFVLGFDNHGDQADPATVAAFKAFVADWNPQIRVHGGDNWNFANLRKGASDDEKAMSLEEDWEAGEDFLGWYLSGGEERVFLRGNHDERLWNFLRNATGLVRDYAHDGTKRVEALMRKCKAKMLPYDSALGIHNLGKLAVLHGYFHGVNACRQHANTYGNCCFGHIHTCESAPVPSLKPASADAIPCLCIRDMDYMAAKTAKLRWAQGWAFGELFEGGDYTLIKVRKINGKFHAATDFKAY